MELNLVCSDKLPKDWVKLCLKDVRRGRSTTFNPARDPNATLELYSVPSHETGKPEIVRSSEIGSSKQYVGVGDVLLSKINPRLNRSWVVGNHSNHPKIASTEWIVFEKNEAVLSSFLQYVLTDFRIRDYLSHNASGVGGSLTRVKPSLMDTIFIGLPPLDEQYRLVAKIEALFSELDKGVESLKTAREQLKIYRQAVLKHAFEGKLTARWREENADKLESPEQLLARIQQEREARYQQQLQEWKAAVKAWEKNGKEGKKPGKPTADKEARPISPEELAGLPVLPEEWRYVRLAEIAKIGSGMSVSRERKLQDPIEVPYLRVANVQRGVLLLNEIKTMPVERQALKELSLQKWDILFNEGGDRDKLGRGWIWESQIEPCITQNHVFRASPYLASDFHAKFISHWGNTFGKDYFDKGGKQTTNLASINKTVLSMFPVPLPSIEEQKQVIQKLDDSMSLIDAMETEMETGLAKAETLRQSILKKSFSGQLVLQDSKDQSATALVKRIHTKKISEKKKARLASHEMD